jgi:hypothetical protein
LTAAEKSDLKNELNDIKATMKNEPVALNPTKVG